MKKLSLFLSFAFFCYFGVLDTTKGRGEFNLMTIAGVCFLLISVCFLYKLYQSFRSRNK